MNVTKHRPMPQQLAEYKHDYTSKAAAGWLPLSAPETTQVPNRLHTHHYQHSGFASGTCTPAANFHKPCEGHIAIYKYRLHNCQLLPHPMAGRFVASCCCCCQKKNTQCMSTSLWHPARQQGSPLGCYRSEIGRPLASSCTKRCSLRVLGPLHSKASGITHVDPGRCPTTPTPTLAAPEGPADNRGNNR